MGNKCSFEATIRNITFSGDRYYIQVSPSKYDYNDYYYLDTSHPQFIDLYNKCKPGLTFFFVTKHFYIQDILPVKQRYITGEVEGFLDIDRLQTSHFINTVTSSLTC